MTALRFLGCLTAVTIAAGASGGCGDDKPAAKTTKSAAVLDHARCERLAKACSEGKHVTTLTDDCDRAVEKLSKRGCEMPAAEVYGCYEQKLCGKNDKVWALDDLRVLAERHDACETEREALRACVAK
ncbi:MAG TPA: hypothetical protein VM261_30040 [Kofleriaceae bacterium]|nr:hypothetical protein [Kofleriaceae bacterium]